MLKFFDKYKPKGKYIMIFEDFDFLRKERKYNDIFQRMHDVEGYTEDQLEELYVKLRDAKNTLKSQGIDPLNIKTWPKSVLDGVKLREETTKKAPINVSIKKAKEEEDLKQSKLKDGEKPKKQKKPKYVIKNEDFVDLLGFLDLIQKANKFIKLIPSHIRKEIKARQKEFQDILVNYDTGTTPPDGMSKEDVNYMDYKKNFLLKSNALRTGDDFFSAIKDHIDGFGSKSEIVQKVQDNPFADVFLYEKDILIAMIFNYTGSNQLGSPSWCIQYSESQWQHYVVNKSNVQYFVWDFNLKNTDNKSKIGVSFGENGMTDAHLKDDDWGGSYVEKQWWIDRLVPFTQIKKEQQLKYCVENPAMERKFGVISKLDTEEKKSMVFKYPKLLQYVDISDFSVEEIFTMLMKDYTIININNSIMKVFVNLSDENIKTLVAKYPALLKDNGVPRQATEKIGQVLTTKEIVNMIINNNNYWGFYKDSTVIRNAIQAMDGETIGKTFDCYFILPFEELWTKVPYEIMREQYLKNKNGWDAKIAEQSNEDLNFTMSTWNHSKEKIKRYAENELYVWNGFKEPKEEADTTQEKLGIVDMSLMDPNGQDDHQIMNMLKMKCRFAPSKRTFGIWAPRGTFGSEKKIPDANLTDEVLAKSVYGEKANQSFTDAMFLI